MHSLLIIVNNTVLYLKASTGIDLECSHHEEEMVIMWPHGGVS